MSAMFREVGFAVVDDLGPGEARRMGRWNARAAELAGGEIAGARFRRLVGAWRPLRGMYFEADPDVVLAVLTARREAGDAVFVYETVAR